MSNVKEYSIKELASILGCSVTAVQKKIKPDKNNPKIKRYKQRFNTILKDGKTFIQLTDEELEQEKNLSKGFNNVLNNVAEDSENVIYNGNRTENTENKEQMIDKILNFTNGYIQRYETLQKTFYEEMQNKDKQIYLLTTSENTKQAEYLQAQAKQKELETKNKRLLLYLIVVTTLFITFIIFYITFQIK